MRAPRVMTRARIPARLVSSTDSMRVPSDSVPNGARRACAATADCVAKTIAAQPAAAHADLNRDIVTATLRYARPAGRRRDEDDTVPRRGHRAARAGPQPGRYPGAATDPASHIAPPAATAHASSA